jgi:hypothetical protein
MHACALGKCLGDVGRRGLAISGQETRADKIADVEKWPELFRFGRRQELHLHAKALGRGGEAAILDPTVLVGGKAQAAGHFPAGGLACFGFELLVEIDRVLQHLGDGGRGAQLAHKASGMPGRA